MDVSLKNFDELADEIAGISEEEFRQKSKEKNFASWIGRYIQDEHYSQVFAQIKDRRLLLQAIQRRINDIEAQRKQKHHFKFYMKEFLIGLVIGAVAMLMVTRAAL